MTSCFADSAELSRSRTSSSIITRGIISTSAMNPMVITFNVICQLMTFAFSSKNCFVSIVFVFMICSKNFEMQSV